MLIEGKQIGGDSCFVVCEVGHNHGGDLKTAERMVRVAAECGADSVKFQKRDLDSCYTREFLATSYNSENAYGPTYRAHREALELSWNDYVHLKRVAEEVGITLFATAFDKPSVDFCYQMGFPAIKIASGDLTDLPLIEYAAQTELPILLSTGGGQLRDVDRAVGLISPNQLVLMQCTALYPCPADKLDLLVIGTYRSKYPDAVVGASLHFNGISVAPVAYTLGARVIEMHLTLNRASKGTDHSFSLEPQGFAKMVRDLRRTEVALGDGEKVRHPDEDAALYKMAKSLRAARFLSAGTVLSSDDLTIKSPGDGLPPSALSQIVGQTTTSDLLAEEPIELRHLSRASA